MKYEEWERMLEVENRRMMYGRLFLPSRFGLYRAKGVATVSHPHVQH